MARAGRWARAAPARVRRVPQARGSACRSWRRRRESHRRDAPVRVRWYARDQGGRRLREGPGMSRLRAKCPDCKTYTAVAIGPDYECHACGRVFHSGMVRVPQAWGEGGEAMAESAWLELPFPEAAVVEAESLEEQNLALAADLPERPLVLGGDCCSHIGAVEGLAARQGRVSVVWFDAHGDLNTPERSTSGNKGGMPMRHVIRSSGLHAGEDGIEQALDGVECTYVALDVDVLEPSEMSVFMPEPQGPSRREVERILASVAGRTKVLGAGFTGLTFEPANIEPL